MIALEPTFLLELAAMAAVAVAAGWVAVAATIRAARRAGLGDRRHDERDGGPAFRDVPRLGGVGIIVVIAAGVALAGLPTPLAAVGVIAVVVGVIGVVDDVRPLGGTTKLLALVVAGSLAWMAGLRLETLPGHAIALPLPLAILVTIGWLTLVPTALNIVDGLDGLAAGLGSIASAAIGVCAVALGDHVVAVIAVITLGATSGFWLHNHHPARVFMGDGGAMFLGFVLAAISLRLLGQVQSVAHAGIILAGLAWPLFELASTVIRRIGGGLMRADAGHLHHLLHRRLGHRLAVRRIHATALAPLVVMTGLASAADGAWRGRAAAPPLAVATSNPGGSPVSESQLP